MNKPHPRFFHDLVAQFHQAFEVKNYRMLHEVPDSVLTLRVKLIDEEKQEWIEADTRLEELDAICDLIYVLVGSGVQCGVPLMEIGYTWDKYDTMLEAFISNVETPEGPTPCPKKFKLYGENALGALINLASIKGYKIYAAFTAVHLNNMDKLWTERPEDKSLIVAPKGDKFLVRRPDGKILKPVNHKKVDLTPYT